MTSRLSDIFPNIPITAPVLILCREKPIANVFFSVIEIKARIYVNGKIDSALASTKVGTHLYRSSERLTQKRKEAACSRKSSFLGKTFCQRERKSLVKIGKPGTANISLLMSESSASRDAECVQKRSSVQNKSGQRPLDTL